MSSTSTSQAPWVHFRLQHPCLFAPSYFFRGEWLLVVCVFRGDCDTAPSDGLSLAPFPSEEHQLDVASSASASSASRHLRRPSSICPCLTGPSHSTVKLNNASLRHSNSLNTTLARQDSLCFLHSTLDEVLDPVHVPLQHLQHHKQLHPVAKHSSLPS